MVRRGGRRDGSPPAPAAGRGSPAPREGAPGTPAREPVDETAAPTWASAFPKEGPGRFVALGEFGRAVGLKGEVRLKSFTADAGAVLAYDPLLAADGTRVVIEGGRPVPGTADMLVVRVAGIHSREAAEALNRRVVGVPRERLGPGEAEGEFLQADLVGLPVFGPDGVQLGQIVGVANYGAGDLLDIRPLGARASVFVPFQDAFVPQVDLTARRVVLAGANLLAIDRPRQGGAGSRGPAGGRPAKAPRPPRKPTSDAAP